VDDPWINLMQNSPRDDRRRHPPTLVAEINQIAAMLQRPLDAAIAMIKLATARDVDVYLLVGSLIEGISTAIAAQIPGERQGEVAVEAVRLLRDRMRRYNVI
jgi:hypothetical protein